MSDTEFSSLDGISPPFLFEIELDNDQPIALGNLGFLFAGLSRAVAIWSAHYFENDEDAQVYLRSGSLSGWDARLSLALYDAHHSRWTFHTTFVGTVATGLLTGLLANNADRIFQNLGFDLAQAITSVNSTPAKELPPFEEACKRAIDAAVKLNVSSVICRVKEGDRVLREIEIRRSDPRPSHRW